MGRRQRLPWRTACRVVHRQDAIVLPERQVRQARRQPGIFTSYTSGINAATTPYVAILDHDDEVDLVPIVAYLNEVGERHDLIYTDEVRFGQG